MTLLTPLRGCRSIHAASHGLRHGLMSAAAPTLVEQLNHLQLSARSVVEGAITGQYRSPVKGASVEFRQHRFYTPGDELRRLDWRVLARTDRTYIKEYD